jgi:Protein of unknown function (DUF4242)
MPRYVVERSLEDGLPIVGGIEDAKPFVPILEPDAEDGVTWLHSYVSDDGRRSFCVYDAPTPEAIRKTAARNDLPVDRITQVRVLDAYPYTRRV